MRRLLSVLAVCVALLPSPMALAVRINNPDSHQPYNYVISKDSYTTADIFQIRSKQNQTYPGTVKKSAFRIRTNYDLSNMHGWQATGITRVMSLGSLYNWAKEIDIYDTRSKKIGFIDGQFATLESAKFSIYQYDDNGDYSRVGVAYANGDFTRFTIVPSEHNPHAIVDLHRNYSDNTWTVTVNYPEKIDGRVVRIFFRLRY